MVGGSGRGYESCSFTEPKRTRCLVHYGRRRQLFFRRSLAGRSVYTAEASAQIILCGMTHIDLLNLSVRL